MVAFNLGQIDMAIDLPILLELPNQFLTSEELNSSGKGRSLGPNICLDLQDFRRFPEREGPGIF